MADRVRIVFGGDTAFGESYQARYAAAGGRNILAERGYAHCSAKLAPLLRRADHVVLNLETPLSARRENAVANKTYVHWADPEKSVAALKDLNVAAVSLANNHAADLGPAGLEDTFTALSEAGIAAFGAGENADSALRAHLAAPRLADRELPVAVIGAYVRNDSGERQRLYAADGRAGVAPLDVEAVAAEIARVRAARPDAFVIAFPHWGGNYLGRTPDQVEIADALFAAGADLILGHGAHRLQEIERRDGRWAVFGLGNFVFNSGGRYAKFGSTPLSLVAELVVELKDGRPARELRLYPIYSDNRVTDYQPRFVTDGEFSLLLNALKELAKPEGGGGEMTGARDELGWCVRMRIAA
jgi:poly-gamma-glutamate capsule biosynthesis protein CapA/YwtB (metallophosphatase superfamily)